MRRYYREFITAVDQSAKADGGFGYWCLGLCTALQVGTLAYATYLEVVYAHLKP